MASPKALFTRVREQRPSLDHLVRTVERYQAAAGDRLTAAVTYYWFLSLFPIVLLAVSLLGYVYGDDARHLRRLRRLRRARLLLGAGRARRRCSGPRASPRARWASCCWGSSPTG